MFVILILIIWNEWNWGWGISGKEDMDWFWRGDFDLECRRERGGFVCRFEREGIKEEIGNKKRKVGWYM